MKTRLTGLTGRIRRIGLIGRIGLISLLAVGSAGALDFHATPESVWREYVHLPMPQPLTDARLRLSLDLAVLGAPSKALDKASPMGVRMVYWERVIARHGLPLVAAEYVSFLHELKAELVREQQQAKTQN